LKLSERIDRYKVMMKEIINKVREVVVDNIHRQIRTGLVIVLVWILQQVLFKWPWEGTMWQRPLWHIRFHLNLFKPHTHTHLLRNFSHSPTTSFLYIEVLNVYVVKAFTAYGRTFVVIEISQVSVMETVLKALSGAEN